MAHSCGSIPGADLPSSAAGNEDEDGGDEQRHQQDGGEDHQEQHVAIPPLLRLERDLSTPHARGERERESGTADQTQKRNPREEEHVR